MHVCILLDAVDAPLIAAGSLALLGAAVHGAGGEVLVVRKLSPAALPPTTFGGPTMTMAMIHASWHLTTAAFAAVGVAMILSGSVLDGDAARAVAVVGAVASTGFAATVVALGLASVRSPRAVLRHPGPPILTLTAALAWWGTLALT